MPSSRPSAPSTSASSTTPATAQDVKPTRRVPSVVARARGGLAQPSSTSRRSLSGSPQVEKTTTNALEESTIASQLPPPPPPADSRRSSLAKTGVDVALPSSPARRPIGAREKRGSLGAAGRERERVRASLGRKSLGFGGAVPHAEQGQADAKQEDAEAEGEKTPTNPSPSIASQPTREAHRFPPQITQQQVDVAVKAVWAGLGLGGWRGKSEREGREGGAGETGEEWRETMCVAFVSLVPVCAHTRVVYDADCPCLMLMQRHLALRNLLLARCRLCRLLERPVLAFFAFNHLLLDLYNRR